MYSSHPWAAPGLTVKSELGRQGLDPHPVGPLARYLRFAVRDTSPVLSLLSPLDTTGHLTPSLCFIF